MKKNSKLFFLLLATLTIPKLCFSGLTPPSEYVTEIHINLSSCDKRFEITNPTANKNYLDTDDFYIRSNATEKPFLNEDDENPKPNKLLFDVENFTVKEAFNSVYTYFKLLTTTLGANLNTLYFNREAQILNFTIQNLDPKDLKRALQKCSFLLENKDEFPALSAQLQNIVKDLKSQKKIQQEIILEISQAIANYRFKKNMPTKKHSDEEKSFLYKLLAYTVPCALPMDTSDDD
ncbi:MAG: hypothetical protein ABH827_04650 [bacterium]